MKRTKKLLASLLAVIIVIGSLQSVTFAAQEGEPVVIETALEGCEDTESVTAEAVPEEGTEYESVSAGYADLETAGTVDVGDTAGEERDAVETADESAEEKETAESAEEDDEPAVTESGTEENVGADGSETGTQEKSEISEDEGMETTGAKAGGMDDEETAFTDDATEEVEEAVPEEAEKAVPGGVQEAALEEAAGPAYAEGETGKEPEAETTSEETAEKVSSEGRSKNDTGDGFEAEILSEEISEPVYAEGETGEEPETGASPVIAMTYIPAWGEKRLLQGQVFMEDGSDFNPADYRVSLYLQLSEGGDYYVKPTNDVSYVNLGDDGSFAGKFITGGDDIHAKILHVMLVPASFTPATFDQTKAVALDYVKITRSEDGEVNADPSRVAPAIQPAFPVTVLPVSRNKIAVDVGFYTDGSTPGSSLSELLIRQQLEVIAPVSEVVRFYSAGGETAKAYQIAHDMGFSIVGTAWLSKDAGDNQEELDALVENCKKGYAQVACVGSETLLRGDLSATQLVEYIRYVRGKLADNGISSIPVTTADSWDVLMENPFVRNACDIIMPNCYPYWAEESIEDSKDAFTESIAALQALCGNKQIVVSETGWPTEGQTKGHAVAGEENAARYFSEIREWSLSTGTQVLWFDAADEPWKRTDEGEAGAHWGIFTKDFALKPGYAATDFFKDYDNPSGGQGDVTTPEIDPIVPEPEKTPVIALTHAPAYGENNPFEGIVFWEDGSAFTAGNYIATLYLGGPSSYWVKPSADRRYVTLNADGSFSIPYTIAATDKNMANIWILLFPASYTGLPVQVNSESEFNALKESALDVVHVDRKESGDVFIEPSRSISIKKAVVSGVSGKAYTGSKITQTPELKVGNTTLKPGTDFEVSYSNNIEVGTATMTITGKGIFTGSRSVTFKINPAAQPVTVKASKASVAVGKTVKISVSGVKEKASCKYKSSEPAIATVSSAGKVTAKKVGTVKITVTTAATKNYKATSKTVKVKVVPAATASVSASNLVDSIKVSWKKVIGATGYKVYRNSTLVKKISKGTTVTFTDKKAVTNGAKYTYKIVATASTGASTLSKSLAFYRVARPAISSAANTAAGKITVKWNKNAKATGYQIQYSTVKTFPGGTKTKTAGVSSVNVSKVIQGLKKGSTYYVRMRSYKTVAKKKYYSAWSVMKTVNIKK